MKRTKQTTDEIEWIKRGRGSLRIVLGGTLRVIKPNQRFMASPDQIPESFKDLIKPVEAFTEDQLPEVVETTPLKYELQQRGETGPWWDIVDSQGKVVNEKALRLDAANKFITELLAK